MLQSIVVTSCLAAVLAAPPPLSVAPPDASKPVAATEYPLSCSDIAKPMVFRGWDALSNARLDEARDTLKLTLVADPHCVMAQASLGAITPGPEGKKLFDAALESRSRVGEVERLDLEAMRATRNGELRKALELTRELVKLAPDVLMVNLSLAHAALALEEWDEAESAAKRATELNPGNGAGWNLLGYSRLRAHRNPQAIEAFRKYVEVAPTEPNAHDSLGDALLADDQLEAAVTEYQRAIDDSAGKFWVAWSGVATVKALENDWTSARAAIEGQKAAAIEPIDKLRADVMMAWSWAAQGRLPDALEVVDAAQREAVKTKVDAAAARMTLLRGQLNLASGRYPEAIKAFSAAERLEVNQLATGQRKRFRGQALSGLAAAQARQGRVADATRTVVRLEAFAKANLTGPLAADTTAYARGVLALAKRDAGGAVQELEKCSEPNSMCHLVRAEAQELAGLPEEAAETRTALVKANQREPEYWFVRARLELRMKDSAM